MNPTANANSSSIEPTVRALGQLSPSSQGVAIALIRQLAEREGVSVALAESPVSPISRLVSPEAITYTSFSSFTLSPLSSISPAFTHILQGLLVCLDS